MLQVEFCRLGLIVSPPWQFHVCRRVIGEGIGRNGECQPGIQPDSLLASYRFQNLPLVSRRDRYSRKSTAYKQRAPPSQETRPVSDQNPVIPMNNSRVETDRQTNGPVRQPDSQTVMQRNQHSWFTVAPLSLAFSPLCFSASLLQFLPLLRCAC